ncbi:MAG TPA: hypothetical protein VH593_32120 [Ktedonobacteraceae bacterium]|jgi:hypothetical protein
MTHEAQGDQSVVTLAEPVQQTRRQLKVRGLWVVLCVVALADEGMIQVLAWWQIWAHARANAVVISAISLALGIVTVYFVMRLMVYWLIQQIEPSEANASVLVGTYAGKKAANKRWIRRVQPNRSIPIRVAPLRFGVTAAGWGQNWNADSFVQVETVPHGVCWVDVYYTASRKAARHHHLDACIRADRDGRAVWNWQPQQMPIYVGTTRITAYVRHHRSWNDTIAYFELGQ